MKILIVNSRYFVSGGPERYMFNLTDLLTANGHDVIPFCIRYTANQSTPYEQYFVSPLSGPDAVYFRDHASDFTTLKKTLQRAFYSREVYDGLSRMIRAIRPDAAIVLQYLRKLSPSVLTALHDQNIPFVVRLSDFGMICPNAHLIRDGALCERCIGGSLLNSVRYKCVQRSLGASLVNYLAMRYHRERRYFDLVPVFAVPSRFTIGKMVEAGWTRDRFAHLPTFVEPRAEMPAKERHGIVYVGRIERTKGVHLLLEAARILRETYAISVPIRIVGSGSGEYRSSIEEFVSRNRMNNVLFTGSCTKDAVLEHLAGSRFSVVPSLWYDNMPNSLLESMAAGTPAIVPGHGSFPEIVRHGRTGLHFYPGEARDLAARMKDLLGDPVLCSQMGKEARLYVHEHHSPQAHYDRLMEIVAGLPVLQTQPAEYHLDPV